MIKATGPLILAYDLWNDQRSKSFWNLKHHQNVIICPLSHQQHFLKFHQNPFINFQVILFTANRHMSSLDQAHSLISPYSPRECILIKTPLIYTLKIKYFGQNIQFLKLLKIKGFALFCERNDIHVLAPHWSESQCGRECVHQYSNVYIQQQTKNIPAVFTQSHLGLRCEDQSDLSPLNLFP